MIDWENPITLESKSIRLIPLLQDHKEALVKAASDGELWNLWFTSVPSRATVDQYMKQVQSQIDQKSSLPFAVFHKEDQRIIGTTRYCNIDEHNRRVEIGYTWYAKSYQRSAVNTECKQLLLQQAFEVYHCIAVEFRTHWFNHPSRNAILRLGAKQDGLIRNHKILEDGTIRDTVVFSILNSEWPTVKKALELKQKKYDI